MPDTLPLYETLKITGQCVYIGYNTYSLLEYKFEHDSHLHYTNYLDISC